MDGLRQAYGRVTGILSKALVGFAAAVFGLYVASIFLEACGRSVLSTSRAFMEEFPRLLIPWVVFPLMGVLLKAGKHISVDLLPQRLTGRARAGLLLAVHGTVLLAALGFTWAGVAAVAYFRATGFDSLTEIVMPIWVTYLPFPVGFGLLALSAGELILSDLAELLGAGLKKEARP
jgi:TRAP-type C4-dicarboxylate transport system permease small subunit